VYVNTNTLLAHYILLSLLPRVTLESGLIDYPTGSSCNIMAPPRRRPQFNPDAIDQQLQQIHLLDPASSSENLEQLGPIIRQIHINRQQEVYLRAVQGLIDSKDAEIEKICSENYQEFIASVSTLFTVKSYTNNLREKITSLDASVSQVGKSLVQKKRAHLQSKKTSANLDEAIDTLQSCLRVLDVVDRVGEMVREGKYWSALRVCSTNLSPVLTTMSDSYMIAVLGRYTKSAANIPVAHSLFSAFAIIYTVSPRTDQGSRSSLYQAMVTRSQKHEQRRWRSCSRVHGTQSQKMAS
jgi:hypothetical protein